MKYFLDCEFNGFGGELMSMGLVRADGESLYLVYPKPKRLNPWVKANVWPIMWDIPSPLPGMAYSVDDHPTGARTIASFLWGDTDPVIVSDWPDDIRYFCQSIITAPGMMANIDRLKFEIERVDAYPTRLPGAVQHNAWWDAQALRHKLMRLP